MHNGIKKLAAGIVIKAPQQSLKNWGDQKWRTKSGKPSSKTGERYLPEAAITAASPGQSVEFFTDYVETGAVTVTLKDAEGLKEIDIDQNRELTAQYSVRSVPTLVFLQDGKEVDAKIQTFE